MSYVEQGPGEFVRTTMPVNRMRKANGSKSGKKAGHRADRMLSGGKSESCKNERRVEIKMEGAG